MSEVILFLLLIGVVVSFLFIITSDRPTGNVEYSSVATANGADAKDNNGILNVLELVKFKDVEIEPARPAPKVDSSAPKAAPVSERSISTPPPQLEKKTNSHGPLPEVLPPTALNDALPEPSPTHLDNAIVHEEQQESAIEPGTKVFSVKNGLKNPIIPSESSVLPKVDFDDEPISPKGIKALQRAAKKDQNEKDTPKISGFVPLAPSSALHDQPVDRNTQDGQGVVIEPLNLSELDDLSEQEQIDRIMAYLQQTGQRDESNYQASVAQLQQLYQAQYQKLRQLEIQKENPSWEIEQVSKELEHERQQTGMVQQQLDFTQEEKQFLAKENGNLKLRLNKSEQAQITLENDLVKAKQRLNLITILATVVVASGLGITLILNQMGNNPEQTPDNEESTAIEN